MLRLKKAKFGHRINDIVPDHSMSFYLPDKSKYLPPETDNGSKSNFSIQRSQVPLKGRSSTQISN